MRPAGPFEPRPRRFRRDLDLDRMTSGTERDMWSSGECYVCRSQGGDAEAGTFSCIALHSSAAPYLAVKFMSVQL